MTRTTDAAAGARAGVVVLLLLPLMLSACRSSRFIANQMTASLADQVVAFEREPNVRHAREAGPGMLLMLDGLLVSAPENRGLLLAGARLNAVFAFALIEEEDRLRALDLYARARSYGDRALARRGERATWPADGAELADRLARMDRDDVPALFWTAFAWGARINLERADPAVVADVPTVQRLLERVVELDESFAHAGPHLALGLLLSARSRALGGAPDAGRRHFERCLELTGRRYLMAQVLCARTYAVTVQDRALFVRLLQEVRAAPRDLDPDQALANAVARERADRLLRQVDDLFLPDLPPEADQP